MQQKRGGNLPPLFCCITFVRHRSFLLYFRDDSERNKLKRREKKYFIAIQIAHYK